MNAPITKEKAFAAKRQLPDNPEDFKKAIEPCAVMVRPILSGISKLCEVSGSLPLDPEEKASGTVAFSALMYQAGGMLDARVLVALWMAGVTIPRAAHWFEQAPIREAKRKKELEDIANGRAYPVDPTKVSGL